MKTSLSSLLFCLAASPAVAAPVAHIESLELKSESKMSFEEFRELMGPTYRRNQAAVLEGNFSNSVLSGNFADSVLSGNFANSVLEGNFGSRFEQDLAQLEMLPLPINGK